MNLLNNEDLDCVQNEINDDDYKLIYDNFENTTLYQKIIPGFSGSSKKRWKCTGTFPFSTDTVFITLSSDTETRKSWDSNQVFCKVIETLKEKELENVIYHVRFKFPWPLSDREWVCLSTSRMEKVICDSCEKNKFVTYSYGIEHEDVKISDDAVLLENYFWSVTLEPVMINNKEHCRYWIISQSNLNGWIPDSLLDWAVKAIPKEFENNVIEGCKLTTKQKLKIEDLKKLEGFQIKTKK
eukprot:gene4293-7649_t